MIWTVFRFPIVNCLLTILRSLQSSSFLICHQFKLIKTITKKIILETNFDGFFLQWAKFPEFNVVRMWMGWAWSSNDRRKKHVKKYFSYILIGFRFRFLQRRILGWLYFDALVAAAVDCYFLTSPSTILSSSVGKCPVTRAELFLGYLIFYSYFFPRSGATLWLGPKPLYTFFFSPSALATFNLMRNFLEGPQIFFTFCLFHFLFLYNTHTYTLGSGSVAARRENHAGKYFCSVL